MLAAPTCEELFNGELLEVHRESDDSWRHGSYVTQIFHREVDSTWWAAAYALSTDGETHGLREGSAEIYQVVPKQVTTISWVPVG